MPKISRLVHIHGRVQGVNFREWTEEQAKELGVHGWVRNREDGTVEAFLTGEEYAVQSLVARCHAGPPKSRVKCIDTELVADDASVNNFTRRPTE